MRNDVVQAKVDELIVKLCDQAIGHIESGTSQFPETIDAITRLLEAGSNPPESPQVALIGFRVDSAGDDG